MSLRPSSLRSALAPIALGAVLLGGLLACGGGDDGADAPGAAPGAPTAPATTATAPASPTPSSTRPPTPTPTSTPAQAAPFGGRHVVAISIDGLNPDALRTLGRDGAPAIWSLIDRGTATLDARAEVEQTVTLPNHVGMVTGRPIDPAAGGHGVTWNDDLPGRTVQQAAGEPVASVFDVVHDAGGSTAVFAGKTKFDLLEASWPDAIDTIDILDDLPQLTTDVTADLADQHRTFTFVHVAEPDLVGHVEGWLSPAYLDAVRRSDAFVGRLLEVVDATPQLRDHTVVVLTADHGGRGLDHGDPALADDYTIPFVVAGDGVPAGDLYDLSPGLRDPGTGRPSYAGPQPIRNCDLANVSLRALGLAEVPGSRCVGARSVPVRRP
ncbi:alkaline phosphatase family protein [Nocardioides rubriscoriae]|uniref:alkaline phosphatase family protein n=1 Tax=Nocardioides rubriscoriae TaxID=642762 RepID=UPI0011DF42F1|nr:alkaline phosphatase family protein [Nocardioides rubriscoriae]